MEDPQSLAVPGPNIANLHAHLLHALLGYEALQLPETCSLSLFVSQHPYHTFTAYWKAPDRNW